jgi:hypothetical protein
MERIRRKATSNDGSDVIVCIKKLEGCGFINHSNVDNCVSCGITLKTLSTNSEGYNY